MELSHNNKEGNTVKRNRVNRRIVFFMIFALLLSPAMTSAQGIEEQKMDYLALGDSLAAGQTPNQQLGKGVYRFYRQPIE